MVNAQPSLELGQDKANVMPESDLIEHDLNNTLSLNP